MSTDTIKVWSWRHAIQRAQISSTTKLVLLNLAIHMNDAGENCYPSTAKQAKDTGLSERSVCTHLEVAEKAGFIKRKRHGYGGQNWARTEYIPTYPPEMELGNSSIDNKEDFGTERASVPSEKALNLTTEGTEPDDIKALNDVQSNIDSNNSSRAAQEKAAAAEKLISAFDIILAQEFGTNHKRTSPREEDLQHALAFIAAGADVHFCKTVFRKKMAFMSKRGHKAPGGLAYFEKIIPEELAREKQSSAAAENSSIPFEEVTLESLGGDSEENRILLAVFEKFRKQASEASYRSWISRLRIAERLGNRLRLSAPSKFIANYITTHYENDLLRLFRQFWPDLLSVSILCEPFLTSAANQSKSRDTQEAFA